MSQNAHSLLLFFEGEQSYRTCLKILRLLEKEHMEEAHELGDEWGVDLPAEWEEEWFNQSVSPTAKFIRIDYETATGYELPLTVLQQMFASGLRAACLEVFYDQVGEFGQFFFMKGQLVEAESLFSRYPAVAGIVEQEFQCDGSEVQDHGYQTPIAISQLTEQQQEAEARGKEMMDAILQLSTAAQKTGVNPVELAKSVLVLRAGGKGLIHAALFGVITVLLFKGIWLWLGLTAVLLVFLPLSYSSRAAAEFNRDDKDEGGEEAVC